MEKAKKRKRVSTFDIINVTAMVLVGLVMLLPVLNLVAKAFSSEGNVIAGKVLFWPVDFQTSTIQYVLTTPEFGTSFMVSVIVTIFGTLGAMFLTVMAAYFLYFISLFASYRNRSAVSVPVSTRCPTCSAIILTLLLIVVLDGFNAAFLYRYPSATSSSIISAKPSAAPMVPMLLCVPDCDSGISSSTTT